MLWHNVGGDPTAPALVLTRLTKRNRVTYQLHLIDQGKKELVAINDTFPAAVAELQRWAKWSAENGQTHFPTMTTQYLPTRDLGSLTTQRMGNYSDDKTESWSKIIQVPGS